MLRNKYKNLGGQKEPESQKIARRETGKAVTMETTFRLLSRLQLDLPMAWPAPAAHDLSVQACGLFHNMSGVHGRAVCLVHG